MKTATTTPRQRYVRQLQSVILRHALYRGDVHADEVVAALPVPAGVHPNNVGNSFSVLEKAGLIKAVGYRRSDRGSRHHGVSRIWRVSDAAGARGYIKALATTEDDHDPTY